MADDDGGDDRPDTEDVGDRGARRGDGGRDPVLECRELGVEAPDVSEQLEGHAPAFDVDELDRAHRPQGRGGLHRSELAGQAASGEQAH